VLVAGDDPASVATLGDMLPAAAYHVAYAATGLARLARLQAGAARAPGANALVPNPVDIDRLVEGVARDCPLDGKQPGLAIMRGESTGVSRPRTSLGRGVRVLARKALTPSTGPGTIDIATWASEAGRTSLAGHDGNGCLGPSVGRWLCPH